MDRVAGDPMWTLARFCKTYGNRRLRIAGMASLSELILVLAIMLVLVGLAAPNFLSLIQKQKIDAATTDLIAAIMLTRSEAIRRNQRVDLIPVDLNNWTSGWSVSVAADRDKPDGEKKIIYTHAAVAQGIAIKSVMKDSAMPYLAYVGSGRTRTNASSQMPQVGHFSLALGRQQRKIVLNFLGRPRICNPVQDSHCD